MSKDYRSDVRKSDELVASLEASGLKGPESPLSIRYRTQSKPKFGGKKRHTGNSGGTGRSGRREKRKYLGTGSGPQWSGPKRS